MIHSRSQKRLVMALFLFATSRALFAAPISIDFEGINDSTFLTTQYSGVTFSNALVLKSGITLNEVDFPPRSGVNVASDSGGPMSLVFSTPAQDFFGYFTYTVPVTLRGFDPLNNLLATATSLFAANLVSGGDPGSNPNELVRIASATGFSKVVITGAPSGTSFTLDDATYATGPVSPIPEPSSMILTGLAVLLFATKASRRL